MSTELAMKIPEGIQKLTKSSNIDDILIGIIWHFENLGRDWCLENFNFSANKADRKHPTKGITYDSAKLTKFGDIFILIGAECIEAYTQASRYEHYRPEYYYVH